MIENCSWCGNTLDSEEKENPRLSENKEVICDQCYEDEYQDRCAICTEIVDKTELNHFLITEEVIKQMSNVPSGTGIYKPLRFPFYYGSILRDEAFFIGAIEKIAELPEGQTREYGEWVCDRCMTLVSKEIEESK